MIDRPSHERFSSGAILGLMLASSGTMIILVGLLLPQVRPLIAAAVVLYAVTLWRATRG